MIVCVNITTKIKTTRILIIAYIADKGKASVRAIADVLEWINEQMGELPLPRKGEKRKFNKPLNLWSVPH
jgi:hypothetical protein